MLAVGCVLVGLPLTLVLDGGVAFAIGVICLLAFVALGSVALAGETLEGVSED